MRAHKTHVNSSEKSEETREKRQESRDKRGERRDKRQEKERRGKREERSEKRGATSEKREERREKREERREKRAERKDEREDMREEENRASNIARAIGEQSESKARAERAYFEHISFCCSFSALPFASNPSLLILGPPGCVPAVLFCLSVSGAVFGGQKKAKGGSKKPKRGQESPERPSERGPRSQKNLKKHR